MADTLKPRDAKEVEDAVRWALGNDKALELAGQGTKRVIGRPSQTDLTLDLSALTGVTLYEPAELVLSARAGTPLAEIEALLDKNNQELAFEPMDYGPLLGGEANGGTLGGAIAANLSGPRRIKAGAARDHFLGVTAITGRGETIKSGGRVVKNVTGYDLCKLLAGSWGTLAAMTDVTVKVLPKAETEVTVLVTGLNDARACAAMAAAMGSSCDVSGAAHLPDHVASWFAGLPRTEASTVLRLEGFAPSVEHRKAALARLMKEFGPISLIDEKEFARLMAECPECATICVRGRAIAPALAYFGRARQRARNRHRDYASRANVLRLGRRPHLGGDAVCRRARRRCDPRRDGRSWWTRHACTRTHGGAGRDGCLRAGGTRIACADQAREERVSTRSPCSIPVACGRVCQTWMADVRP